MAQRDIVDHDVLHLSLIHFLKGQAAAPHAGAVRYRDVAIAAVRLRTQLDTPAYPVHLLRHVCAIEERAELITCNDTVSHKDMLTRHSLFQGV